MTQPEQLNLLLRFDFASCVFVIGVAGFIKLVIQLIDLILTLRKVNAIQQPDLPLIYRTFSLELIFFLPHLLLKVVDFFFLV